MNMLVTKCACQATSITKRTLSLVSTLVPQNASTTYNLGEVDNCSNVRAFKSFQISCVVG